MGLARRILSSFRPKQDKEGSTHFLNNGSELLEEFIAFSNGRYDIPIRNFTAKEIARATSSFAFSERVVTDRETTMFKGQFEGRQVLVNIWRCRLFLTRNEVVRDIVIASQMSHHKNVLKLVGCCLEFESPAPVYEYVEGILLSHLLHSRSNKILLSWRSRIKIASDIAGAIVYLHTAFSTPVIYRDLKPSKVMIDECGVAKLFDFRLSISLPPGKLHVEDVVLGTYGFADPEYMESGYITQKSDVYSFGVVLLTMLTGKTSFWCNHEGETVFLSQYAKHCADNHEYDQLIDPSILEELRGAGNENLLQCLLRLALRCTRNKADERPEMIDVAKQLRLMEKASRDRLPSINC